MEQVYCVTDVKYFNYLCLVVNGNLRLQMPRQNCSWYGYLVLLSQKVQIISAMVGIFQMLNMNVDCLNLVKFLKMKHE